MSDPQIFSNSARRRRHPPSSDLKVHFVPRRVFTVVSRKTIFVPRREYFVPRRALLDPDREGFMNCQILHMEYFAMLCCTLNHSAIKAAFHTYLRFRERFLVENYIHAFKKPEKVLAKIHCTHCLNAVPKHGSKIRQKLREIYFLGSL